MKIKTTTLIGPALDWAVAKCEGCNFQYDDGEFWDDEADFWNLSQYSPSTDWSLAGPIIEREGINIIRVDDDYGVDDKGFCNNKRIPVWVTEPESDCTQGPTPLVAAMRCYVALKLGDEVEIPEELCSK